MSLKLSKILQSPYLLTICIGIYLDFTIRGEILGDSFHQGEYFTSMDTTRLNSGLDFFGIHGALDWIPVWFAKLFLHGSNFFVLTAILYQILSLLTCLLFLHLLIYTNSKHNFVGNTFINFLSVTSFLFLDYRELGTLLVLHILIKFHFKDENQFQRILLMILVPFAIYWYPGRGVVSLVSAIIILIFRRDLLELAKFVVSWSSIFFMMNFVDPRFETAHLVGNFQFVKSTSFIWRYQTSLLNIPIAIELILSASIILVLLGWNFYPNFKNENFGLIAIYLIHLLAYLFFSLNRADSQHILMSSWWLFLFPFLFRLNGKFQKFFYFVLVSFQMKIFVGLVRGRPDRVFVIALLVLMVLYFFAILIPKASSKILGAVNIIRIFPVLVILSAGILNFQTNHLNLVTGLSGSIQNSDVVAPELKLVSRAILNSGDDCYFDFTNQGLIAGLVNLPSCTFVPYPIYVSPGMQKRLIAELSNASPKVIVYSSPNWSSQNVDGKPMANRIPLVDEFIRENWKTVRCFGETCVRVK